MLLGGERFEHTVPVPCHIVPYLPRSQGRWKTAHHFRADTFASSPALEREAAVIEDACFGEQVEDGLARRRGTRPLLNRGKSGPTSFPSVVSGATISFIPMIRPSFCEDIRWNESAADAANLARAFDQHGRA
jgi:hypothetical protein